MTTPMIVAAMPAPGRLALRISSSTVAAASSLIRLPSSSVTRPRAASSPKTKPAMAMAMMSRGASENIV